MKEDFKGPVECYEYFSREVVLLENKDSLNKAYTDSTYPYIYTLLNISKCAVCPIIRYCLYRNTDLTCLYQNPI